MDIPCICMLDHRLQILLDAERHRRMAAAQERGVSVATIVREAIDKAVPDRDAELRASRRAAADRILAAPDIQVGTAMALRAEFDETRGHRF